MDNLLIVAEQVVVLFLLMATGFLLGKLKWLSDESSAHISRILVQVSLPCVVVKSLQVPFTQELFSALVWGGAALLLQSIGTILLGLLTLRKTPSEIRAPLRFSQVYSNSIFMGLPLVVAVLGDAAAVYSVPMLLVTQALLWTHGVSMMGGTISPRKILLNPGIISIFIGMALFLAGISLPAAVNTALGSIGSINTPLAMIIVGYQMSKVSLKSAFVGRRLYLTVFMHLILSPILVLLILFPLRTTNPLMFCSLVILAAAPVASTAASFAQQYGKDAQTGAQVTTLSTILSLITLPVFAVLVKALSG